MEVTRKLAHMDVEMGEVVHLFEVTEFEWLASWADEIGVEWKDRSGPVKWNVIVEQGDVDPDELDWYHEHRE